MLISSMTYITRGSTVRFVTTFYDADCVVTQPGAATINLVYTLPTGESQTLIIPMVAPTAPAAAWTAQWDSRGAAPGAVTYSIRTDSLPFAVEDGEFVLTANPANLVTF